MQLRVCETRDVRLRSIAPIKRPFNFPRTCIAESTSSWSCSKSLTARLKRWLTHPISGKSHLSPTHLLVLQLSPIIHTTLLHYLPKTHRVYSKHFTCSSAPRLVSYLLGNRASKRTDYHGDGTRKPTENRDEVRRTTCPSIYHQSHFIRKNSCEFSFHVLFQRFHVVHRSAHCYWSMLDVLSHLLLLDKIKRKNSIDDKV